MGEEGDDETVFFSYQIYFSFVNVILYSYMLYVICTISTSLYRQVADAKALHLLRTATATFWGQTTHYLELA